jgi:hypothetical protein
MAVALASAAVVTGNGLAREKSFSHDDVVQEIAHYRDATWHWQDEMGVRHSPFAASATHSLDQRYRRWVLGLWRKRAHTVQVRAQHVPHQSAWLCIHHYEGAWNSHTGNGYYGGLQMDVGFMRTYAWPRLLRRGTADRWSPLQQMWVAERALRAGRGFYPWPNTARVCGLI